MWKYSKAHDLDNSGLCWPHPLGKARETWVKKLANSCLLTRWDGLGLGAEARASEVRPQGEDWGWLHEHSLKGASARQLAGRESGKKSGTA